MIRHTEAIDGCFGREITPIPKYKKICSTRDFSYGLGHKSRSFNKRPISRSSGGHGDRRLTNEIRGGFKLGIRDPTDHEVTKSRDLEIEKCRNEVVVYSPIDSNLPSVVSFPLQPGKSTFGSTSSEMELGRQYPPRRKISAIRDFPLLCGRDRPHHTKDEHMKDHPFFKCSRSTCVQVESEDATLNQSVKLSSFKSGEGSKASGDVTCNLKRIPSLNSARKLKGECQSSDDKKLHEMTTPFCETTAKSYIGTPMKCILPYRDSTNQVAESESGDKIVMSGELGGDVGKDTKVYEAENHNSGQILENGVGICDSKMLHLDDRVGRVIVAGLEGSGSRGPRLNASDKSASRAIVLGSMDGPIRKEAVLHKEDNHLRCEHSPSPPSSKEDKLLRRESSSEHTVSNVHESMAAPNCPWRNHKVANLSSGSHIQKSKRLQVGIHRSKTKSKLKKLFEERRALRAASKRRKASASRIKYTPSRWSYPNAKAADGKEDEVDFMEQDEAFDDFVSHSTHQNGLFLQNDLNDCVSRSKVRETLRLFQAVYRKLLHDKEAILRRGVTGREQLNRMAARILNNQGKYINAGKPIVGPVPGVDIGLEFQFRVELAIIGLHRPHQAGIDYIRQGGTLIATSVVASCGYYADDMNRSDVLIYSGSGGNPTKCGEKAEDQKLERGNLALKNSIKAKNPVRVIRGLAHKVKASSYGKKTYTYDGLYVVTKYWRESGPNGNRVFMFRLERIPGQPEFEWNVISK